MIELEMVRRMLTRGLLLAPVPIVILAAFGGVSYGVSAAIGVALALGNLWFAARVIGGVAENNPQLLLAAAMTAFAVGLAILTGIAFALKTFDIVFFPVTGLVLIGSHLFLVLWEAAGAYGRVPSQEQVPNREAADLRS